MRIVDRIKNAVSSLVGSTNYAYDTLPPETVRAAARLPTVKRNLVQFSLDEYDRNPYYQLVIENLANHTLGKSPSIIAISEKVGDRINDKVEDYYQDWLSENHIGRAYREIRKQAALTGIGVGIPFKNMSTSNPVTTSYKVYGGNCLRNPWDASYEDRIINGIQYDENWEPEKFHLIDSDENLLGMNLKEMKYNTKEYTISEVIYFSRAYRHGILWPMPECYSAFTFYPFVRRYLQAVIESEEFLSSFPMAIELDPSVYRTYTENLQKDIPIGTFEYEPRMIPTLKPGMKLTGMPSTKTSRDREDGLRMFAAACALSVTMPRNLALGDSSNSNMASAQVDIQPWANKVSIDRFDMEPMLRKSFRDWWALAQRRHFTVEVSRRHSSFFPHLYVYPDLFSHPDPNKRAAARALDLASGALTLNRLYSNMGLNFRREMQREADSLGLTVEEVIRINISSRSAQALQALNEEFNARTDTAPSGSQSTE